MLDKFETISLVDMDKIKLLDRVEVKYVFHISQLPSLLNTLSQHYNLLITGSLPVNKYKNVYFDTLDHSMYLDHHNGKLNRYKVRFRTYSNTETTFFETKFKSNKGRTIKTRIEVPDHNIVFEKEIRNVLCEIGYPAEVLQESLKIDYDRITLFSKNGPERVTLDTHLEYSSGTKAYQFPHVVIAEVKQLKSAASVFISVMRKNHIHTFSISKYCFGIASLKTNLKINNFKPKLRHVNKLCQFNS